MLPGVCCSCYAAGHEPHQQLEAAACRPVFGARAAAVPPPAHGVPQLSHAVLLRDCATPVLAVEVVGEGDIQVPLVLSVWDALQCPLEHLPLADGDGLLEVEDCLLPVRVPMPASQLSS